MALKGVEIIYWITEQAFKHEVSNLNAAHMKEINVLVYNDHKLYKENQV